jgi:hypothetical protein
MAEQVAYVLSESERDLFQELVKDYRRRLTKQEVYPEPSIGHGNATYIAFPIDYIEGIPGLTPGGYFDGFPIDTPGMAYCEIYTITDGALQTTGQKEYVYNIQRNAIVNDYITIHQDHFGNWIAKQTNDVFEGILFETLEAATGPLSGGTIGSVIEIRRYDAMSGDTRLFYPSLLIHKVDNKSVSTNGVAGTYGIFQRLNGETRPLHLDCFPSEEGIQVVVEIYDALISGGFGSGSYGDGTFGG